MSSFSINTILLFLALAPGFLALSAFYVFGRLPRRAYNTSTTIELGALASVALFAHLLFGGVFALLIAPSLFGAGTAGDLLGLLLDHASGSGHAAPSASPGTVHLYRTDDPGRDLGTAHFCALTAYALFVCGLAALTGCLSVRAIEREFWFFRSIGRALTGGLYWDAFVSGRMGPIFVYVLTNTQHRGRLLMYSGVLESISLGRSDWIEYVVLSNTSRFLMTIDFDVARTPERRHYIGLDDDEPLKSRIVIPAANISNIAFRPTPVLLTRTMPQPHWIIRRLSALGSALRSAFGRARQRPQQAG